MFLSSIFNFESLRGMRARWPLTALAVVGLVAALELTMRLVPESAIIPGKSRQSEMKFLREEVIEKFPQPKVLLMGSSRIRRAVNPRLLDEQLGLARHSTMNLGIASGRLFEALELYEENKEKLKSAQIVVLGLDEWHLSTGWRLGSVYEFHAPWRERLALPDPLRTRMILDGIFTMRLKLRMALPALATKLGLRKPESVELALTEDYQVLPQARKKLPTDIDPRRFHETIDTFYDRFEIHPVMVAHLEAIAGSVKAAGGKLILMQLPNREAYQKEVEQRPKKEYEQHIKALTEVAKRLNVPLIVYRYPKECGMDDGDYQDYGHMTPEGALKFTRFIAPVLKGLVD